VYNRPFICSKIVSCMLLSAPWGFAHHGSTRTYRCFISICTPLLFHSICLQEFSPERHKRLVATGTRPGELVHDLTLITANGLSDKDTQSIYQTLLHMPNVRSLTVVHERDDITNHGPLQRAIDKFPNLRVITLREAGYDPGFRGSLHLHVRVSETFFNKFLHTALSVHADHLEGIHLYTLLPLYPPNYVKIRDGTPHLCSVTFTASISVGMEDLFAEPTPWASGRSGGLENLILHKCEDTHAGGFVRNVLRGAYGTRLKDVRVITSGGTPDALPFPDLAAASIERLTWDHLADWEASALAHIPVKDLSLTAILHDAFLRLPSLLEEGLRDSDGSKVAFRGLERLRLSPKLAPLEAWLDPLTAIGIAYRKLEQVCGRRGIQLSLDATVWRPCHNRRCRHIG
jgi:hypothetical protein